MIFIVILSIITLAIASCAAYFSIYGLAAIFSGVFYPVVVMGISLEAGKLAAASYVYRFYNNITFITKTYFIAAIIILMLITSIGIFGFLSMGYQKESLFINQQSQQIDLLHTERAELELFKTENLARKKQIDDDIASLPNNYITGRQRLMKSYGDELAQLRLNIKKYTEQINEKTLRISSLKQTKLVEEVHTGPIIFISKAFSAETEDAVKWMMILIMFAFDPLAVMLTLGVSNAIKQRQISMQPVSNGLSDNTEPPISDPEKIITENVPTDSNIDIALLKKEAMEYAQHSDLPPASIVQQSMLEELVKKKLEKNS